MMRVLVIGTGGKLGRRLVSRGLAQGHEVTAFVRSRERLAASLRDDAVPGLRIVEGDATDAAALASALQGHGHAVSAAGNVADGERFTALFAGVLAAADQALQPPRRLWMLAGAAVLTVPHTARIAVSLPFIPKLYQPHAANWRAIEASALDWSLMCPGSMVERVRQPAAALRTSLDVAPYDAGRWTARAPPLALSLLMKAKVADLTVTYEDVAELIMANLAPGRFSRRRVGVALPPRWWRDAGHFIDLADPTSRRDGEPPWRGAGRAARRDRAGHQGLPAERRARTARTSV